MAGSPGTTALHTHLELYSSNSSRRMREPTGYVFEKGLDWKVLLEVEVSDQAMSQA